MVGGLGAENSLEVLHEIHFLLCDLFVGLGQLGKEAINRVITSWTKSEEWKEK
jgi:hypothetical protein